MACGERLLSNPPGSQVDKMAPDVLSFISTWLAIRTRGSDRQAADLGPLLALLTNDQDLRSKRHLQPSLKWCLAEAIREKLREDA